jgi:hypothetical protein
LKERRWLDRRRIQKGNSMRGLFISCSHPSPILLVGLLVFSTHLLWAQRTLLGKAPIRRLDTPAPFARFSEAPTRLDFTSLTFEQNRGQSESRIRFFPHSASYYRLPTNTNAALYPPTGTAELWGNETFVGRAPSKWLTFTPTYGNVPHEATYRVENLEHYGQRIPWAGSIILQVGQQAKAHPHVARVVKLLHPRF